MSQLISLQIGQPQERTSQIADGAEAVWTSGIFKSSVSGRVYLSVTGLDGDGQADLKNHGGPDKAVCCYAAAHYPHWRGTLGLREDQFPFGAFGENFTLRGLTEETVCLGDIYAVGSARVQVSQPRVPCFKLGRRWGLATLPGLVMQNGGTGWYLRVLQTGEVGPGDALTRLERPLPDWPISRLNDAMYVRKDDKELAVKIADLPLLAEAWRSYFHRRAGVADHVGE